MKWALQLKNKLSLLMFVCVNGCMQGTVWMIQIICEFMLHVVGQAQYVERVMQGVGVDPVGGSICKGRL